MLNLEAILRLYSHVISEDIIQHRIKDVDLQEGLQTMLDMYSREFDISKVPDFNYAIYRCAYMHMYAPMYTAVVKTTMLQILSEETVESATIESKVFKMCSLGGGPGTDVIGVMSAFNIIHPVQFESVVTIVDCMGEWKSTFRLILNEFRKRDYGSIALRFADSMFSWNYIESDLLSTTNYKVWDSISSSSLITMNKFISVLRLEDAETMVREIFTVMQPGSFVLFIDDASEILAQMILRIAQENQFISMHGPLQKEYAFEELKCTRFGHTSCYQVNVTSMLFRKPLINAERPIVVLEPHCTKKIYYEECVSLCLKCEKGINKTLDTIIKNSVIDAKCSSCEDEFKTPFSSKSSSPISWKSFGTVAEIETKGRRADSTNNNCMNANHRIVSANHATPLSTIIEIPVDHKDLVKSFGGCGARCVVS